MELSYRAPRAIGRGQTLVEGVVATKARIEAVAHNCLIRSAQPSCAFLYTAGITEYFLDDVVFVQEIQ